MEWLTVTCGLIFVVSGVLRSTVQRRGLLPAVSGLGRYRSIALFNVLGVFLVAHGLLSGVGDR